MKCTTLAQVEKFFSSDGVWVVLGEEAGVHYLVDKPGTPGRDAAFWTNYLPLTLPIPEAQHQTKAYRSVEGTDLPPKIWARYCELKLLGEVK